MKKCLISVVFAMLSVAAFATGQSPDVIYIDNDAWMLLARPITNDSALAHAVKRAVPENRSWSTANWDGITAIWSIRDNKLCLDSVVYGIFNERTKRAVRHCLPAETMRSIFGEYFDGNDIVARWCTDTLRAAHGRKVFYQHAGFMRYHETEQVLIVNRGEVAARNTYHNYATDGLTFEELSKSQIIKTLLPVHVENYPELAGEKCVVFWFSNLRADSSGRIADCEVKVKFKKDGQTIELPALAAEMKAALLSYSPFKIYFINGEYKVLPSSFGIPYPLDD